MKSRILAEIKFFPRSNRIYCTTNSTSELLRRILPKNTSLGLMHFLVSLHCSILHLTMQPPPSCLTTDKQPPPLCHKHKPPFTTHMMWHFNGALILMSASPTALWQTRSSFPKFPHNYFCFCFQRCTI